MILPPANSIMNSSAHWTFNIEGHMTRNHFAGNLVSWTALLLCWDLQHSFGWQCWGQAFLSRPWPEGENTQPWPCEWAGSCGFVFAVLVNALCQAEEIPFYFYFAESVFKIRNGCWILSNAFSASVGWSDIHFHMLNQPCIPGMNPIWLCCLVSVFLRDIFLSHTISWFWNKG